MERKEQLQKALEAVKQGEVQQTAEAVAMLKALDRTRDGVFDLTEISQDEWEIARLAYPVYVAYETVCNKKEGYPDLLDQMRVWNARLQADFCFEKAAKAADMWIHTLEYMSPEIYEYYRELMDIFKSNVRKTLETFYTADSVRGKECECLFRNAVLQACRENILLAEKYENRV